MSRLPDANFHVRYPTGVVRDWQPARRRRYPEAIADWLLYPGSLTDRLRRFGRVTVTPRREGLAAPRFEESRLLGLAGRQQAWLREVTLCVNDIPVIEARSTLPLSSLTGRNRVLGNMARRSLGAELFRQPRATRHAIWVADIVPPGGHLPAPARLSIFLKRGQPLLVGEIFLPALWELSAR